MFGKLFDSNEKQLNKLRPTVNRINQHWEDFREISDEEIKAKTNNWKEEIHKIDSVEKQNAYLDKMLPEAFALAKEATFRADENKILHDVQLMAAIVLHEGKIAEQQTGEGKTNTAVLPMFLNSLTGRGAHLVTPNDYLSRHGAGWMGPIYELLGISVGVVMQERAFVYDPQHEGHEFDDAYAVHLREVERPEAYLCGVTYGTNHEFGFDYLRDNLIRRSLEFSQRNSNKVMGAHNYAVVDEVDSILIDVARTPLIISTQDEKPSERYHDADRIVKSLVKDTDYEVEEKYKNATLTDLGIRRVERMLGVSHLYEQDFEMVHLIEQALAANTLYEKDTDYVVKNGQVVIVDQFTGRLLPNNRYSHGLHQAIEAKEKVQIQQESKTIAEISYQNYFRLYDKLAGMTGTAATEAEEFYKIYSLEVVVLPPHKKVTRIDYNDVVYKSVAAKFKAVADEIEERHKGEQPVLVGTTSVEKSELLHNYLQRKKIPHEILNAKNHEREAIIISQAGKKGSVTISTNMAGRGVDIKLGGDPCTNEEYEEVKSSGGLHIIGTERHESRRIDNQLRGRSGRQGDPGSSRFFVSLQDDLMRIFGGAKIESIMEKFGVDENIPLEAGIVSKSIENAQKRVEGFNFDRRKQVVEMDDIMNVHREVVYKLRRRVLDLGEGVEEYRDWFLDNLLSNADFDEAIWEKYEEDLGTKMWYSIVKDLSLPVIDLLWMEHLVDMSQVRDGIGLSGYAQRDPMVEYKREAHERFNVLVKKMYSSISDRISRASNEPVSGDNSVLDMLSQADFRHGSIETGVSTEAAELQKEQVKAVYEGREIKVEKVESGTEKVGRNDPCPCGSGKKYKKCHGKTV
ncbi:preprotein translocase subunit SecA [Patescibacteria group bacterium]|nr:preprotein translocase subunit SecA [Patescibacteria group bacterium]